MRFSPFDGLYLEGHVPGLQCPWQLVRVPGVRAVEARGRSGGPWWSEPRSVSCTELERVTRERDILGAVAYFSVSHHKNVWSPLAIPMPLRSAPVGSNGRATSIRASYTSVMVVRPTQVATGGWLRDGTPRRRDLPARPSKDLPGCLSPTCRPLGPVAHAGLR